MLVRALGEVFDKRGNPKKDVWFRASRKRGRSHDLGERYLKIVALHGRGAHRRALLVDCDAFGRELEPQEMHERVMVRQPDGSWLFKAGGDGQKYPLRKQPYQGLAEAQIVGFVHPPVLTFAKSRMVNLSMIPVQESST